jgi:hypothetical protein
MLISAKRSVASMASTVRGFHEDEGGESGVQMVMVLALAAICIFGIGKLTGISGGNDTDGGVFGLIKNKVSGLLGGVLGG